MTIREISLKTGLSPATISRALKKPHLVKNHTKELIMNVINQNDKYLKVLNILVPDVSVFPASDIINHIMNYLYDEDVQVILYSSKNDLNIERKIINRINNYNQKDSVLFWFPIASQRDKNFAIPIIPTIVLYHRFYLPNFNPNILSINFNKFVEMTSNLLYKGGAKRLLILIDHGENSILGNKIKNLYNSYILSYCNLLKNVDFLFFEDSKWENVFHLLNKNYENSFPFDSIISLSSSIAYGVVTFLKTKKLSIPYDVSIITFGYDLGFELMEQPISMIYPDTQKAAEHIIYMAAQLIEDPNFNDSIGLNLQSSLLGSERKY